MTMYELHTYMHTYNMQYITWSREGYTNRFHDLIETKSRKRPLLPDGLGIRANDDQGDEGT